MSLEIKLGYKDINNIKTLFDEYTRLLVDADSNFQDYLNLQHYDGEIENLNTKYGLPHGRLYIAYHNKQAAGCIALRRINESDCEMKRLYVKPEYRGSGIAKKLVNLIINDAKSIGYQCMLLDTLPNLKGAIKLYEDVGFYRIPPYNNSPIDDTVFMKLDLLIE